MEYDSEMLATPRQDSVQLLLSAHRNIYKVLQISLNSRCHRE